MIIRQFTTLAVAVAAVCALTAAADSSDGGDRAGLARISAATPFSADCNGPAFAVSAAYVNAEVEPYVAANPANLNNLIAVYQQDRYPDDGANGVLAATSFDGGKSWQVPDLRNQPTFSRCAGGNETNGGDFDLASDPWVDIAPDGTAYFAALSFNRSNAGTAEFVSVSTTGGRSWERPIAVIRENIPDVSDERPSVTADPTRAHTAYLVWARHRSAPASTAAGAIFFSRSSDGGQHWSAARAIYETAIGMQTSANQIVVTPNGELVNVFNELKQEAGSKHPRHDRIAAIRSTDGGASWSQPTTLATSAVAGVADPRTSELIRAGDSFTDIAVDPRPGTNTIYAVWADCRFTDGHSQQIVLAKSTDGGRNWAEPVAVAADPRAQNFVPSVAVNSLGEVAVTYYGFAAGEPPSAALLTHYWMILSKDGGRNWTPAQQLTRRPFDLRTAPFNRGLFLGEYQGLAAAGPKFIAVAAMANGHSLENRTDIYAIRAP